MRFKAVVFLVTLMLSVAACAQNQQCSQSPVVTQNVDGSVTVDLGTCFIFPGSQQGFDLRFLSGVIVPPTTASSITLNYQSPDSMTYGFQVMFCPTINNPVPCVPAVSANFSNGNASYVFPQPHTPLLPDMVIREEISIFDYNTCWAQGYYCYYTASFVITP